MLICIKEYIDGTTSWRIDNDQRSSIRIQTPVASVSQQKRPGSVTESSRHRLPVATTCEIASEALSGEFSRSAKRTWLV